MTNFFTKSTGEQIKQITTFENSGIQAIIPDGTKLHANILEATWEEATQYNNQHILIKWHIIEKSQYNGFIINQKLAVMSNKESKADKAKEMLMAIDSNCKGELFKLAQSGKFTIGDNMQLARALAGGSALITVAEYEIAKKDTDGNNLPIKDQRGNKISENIQSEGNWIRAVSPISKQQHEKKQEQYHDLPDTDEYDQDIPF